MSQLSLDAETDRPPSQRERILATVIAGFVHPGRGTFERLPRAERAACLRAARLALAEARIVTRPA